MQDWLSARAQTSPKQVALVTTGRHVTYSELNRLSSQTASCLKRVGLHAGDRVGLLLEDKFHYAIVIFALARLNAIAVPINSRLTLSEIEFQVRQTACILFIHDSCHHLSLDTFSSICRVISVDELAETKGSEDSIVEGTRGLNDPCVIIHTSGTSGRPKAVVLTYGNMFYSAMASAYRIGHLPNDKWLCCLPLYHVGGLSILVRACLYGIAVDLRQRFDVAEINNALSYEDVTLVSLVPTMLHRLLDSARDRWSDRLRLVLLGGAAASPELIRRCVEQGVPVSTTYGLTEAASQVATSLPSEVVSKPGSVGKSLMFTSVHIVDERGHSLPEGEYGEIVVTGPTIMKEYYNDPESTAQALRNAELHTGDIGYLDSDGDLWIVQRRSDLIISGGENIYPAELEQIMKLHPAIQDVCVVGIEDNEWGQRVSAAIVLRDGASLTTDEITAFCRQSLAGYKVPRTIKFVAELPRTASGKIERVVVKDFFR